MPQKKPQPSGTFDVGEPPPLTGVAEIDAQIGAVWPTDTVVENLEHIDYGGKDIGAMVAKENRRLAGLATSGIFGNQYERAAEKIRRRAEQEIERQQREESGSVDFTDAGSVMEGPSVPSPALDDTSPVDLLSAAAHGVGSLFNMLAFEAPEAISHAIKAEKEYLLPSRSIEIDDTTDANLNLSVRRRDAAGKMPTQIGDILREPARRPSVQGPLDGALRR